MASSEAAVKMQDQRAPAGLVDALSDHRLGLEVAAAQESGGGGSSSSNSSNKKINNDKSGMSGVDGSNFWSCALPGSNASSGLSFQNSTTTAPDETDDIADILDVGLDETNDIADILDVGLMEGLGGLSALSASAKEFTPGGGVNGVAPAARKDPGEYGIDVWSAPEAWTAKVDGEGVTASPTCEWDEGMSAEVRLEAEVLELMAESFSDCSPECLQVALAKSDWDLNRASAAVLFALEAACDPERPSKPCRHLLGGECLRSDCAFSHDFASTTCRYWLQSQCLNFDACHFLHDLHVPEEGLLEEDPGEGESMASKNKRTLRDRSDSNGSVNAGGTGHVLELAEFPSLKSKTLHANPPNADPLSAKPTNTKPTNAKLSKMKPSNSKPSHAKSSNGTLLTANSLRAEALFERASIASTAMAVSLSRTTSVPIEAPPSLDTPSIRSTSGSPTGAHGAQLVVPVGVKAIVRKRDEDVLLAAVAATSKKGAGGRKGNRGRKTRFTAVSIQALIGSTPSTDSGIHVSSPSHPGPPPPPPPPSASEGDRKPAVEWKNESDNSSGSVGGSDLLATVARSTSSNVSFAEVVSSRTNVSGVGRDARQGGDASGRAALGRHSAGAVGNGGARGVESGWVSTGDSVALQYERARMEAAELARARNKFFTSATEAFRRGQGLAARDLARRGRELNVRMKEKHRQASRQIFASRNPGDQVFSRKTMDLHGLHVSEAVEVLETEIRALSARGAESVRVLTGTGHHSKGPSNKARLIPAVENFCQARGFPYRRIPDQGTGHVGVIDITLVGL